MNCYTSLIHNVECMYACIVCLHQIIIDCYRIYGSVDATVMQLPSVVCLFVDTSVLPHNTYLTLICKTFLLILSLLLSDAITKGVGITVCVIAACVSICLGVALVIIKKQNELYTIV